MLESSGIEKMQRCETPPRKYYPGTRSVERWDGRKVQVSISVRFLEVSEKHFSRLREEILDWERAKFGSCAASSLLLPLQLMLNMVQEPHVRGPEQAPPASHQQLKVNREHAAGGPTLRSQGPETGRAVKI